MGSQDLLNPKLLPNQIAKTVLDLDMTRNWGLATVLWIDVNIVFLPVSMKLTTSPRKFTQEFMALHTAMLSSLVLMGLGGRYEFSSSSISS